MAMNDEETVALIAGGHTFGKTHGAAPPTHVGPEPEGCRDRGCRASAGRAAIGTGKGARHDHQRPRRRLDAPRRRSGATTSSSTCSSYEWELTKSPAGAQQWKPKNGAGAGTVPDAHDQSKKHAPMMLTTDLALRIDPAYEKISRRFYEHPDEFADAFAKAWFKLTHRDMGPRLALPRPAGAEGGADLAGPGPDGRLTS